MFAVVVDVYGMEFVVSIVSGIDKVDGSHSPSLGMYGERILKSKGSAGSDVVVKEKVYVVMLDAETQKSRTN